MNDKSMDTPFFLLYGRHAVLPGELLFDTQLVAATPQADTSLTKIDYKIALFTRFRNAYQQLERKRDINQNEYKGRYDKTHRHIESRGGDRVMVFWPIPKKGYAFKLLPKWDGPYQIISRVGTYTYRVSKNSKVFCVHVQRLAKYESWESERLSPGEANTQRC